MELEIPILSPVFRPAYLNVGPYESYRLEGRMDGYTFQQQTAAISSFISANCPRKSTLIISNITFALASLIIIIISITVLWLPALGSENDNPSSIAYFFIPIIVLFAYVIIAVILNSWFAIALGQLDRSLQNYLHSVNVAIAQNTSLRFQLRITSSPIRSCAGFTDPYVMNTLRVWSARGLSQYWVIILSGPDQLNVYLPNYGMPSSQVSPVNPGHYYPPSAMNPTNQGYYPSPVTFSNSPTGPGNLPLTYGGSDTK